MVSGRCSAVQKKSECMGRKIGEIRRIHAHLVPHPAFLKRGFEPHAFHISIQTQQSRLVEIIIVALGFQLLEYSPGIFVRPIRQLHDIVTVGLDVFAVSWSNDNRPIDTGHFLKTGMGVVPIGTALLNFESVGKCFPRRYSLKADAGNTVHIERQNQAMPMNRR